MIEGGVVNGTDNSSQNIVFIVIPDIAVERTHDLAGKVQIIPDPSQFRGQRIVDDDLALQIQRAIVTDEVHFFLTEGIPFIVEIVLEQVIRFHIQYFDDFYQNLRIQAAKIVFVIADGGS